MSPTGKSKVWPVTAASYMLNWPKEGKFFPAAGKKLKNSLDRGKAFQ